MRRNKELILVCTRNHVNKILADIPKLKTNDTGVVVALEYSAQEELDKHQISYRIPEDYTTNETYKDLDKKALSFARTWHSFDAHIEELVTYKGINLGALVEWEFTYFIASVMKYIEMIDCILEKEQPDKIIVVDDNPEVNSVVEADDENLAIKTAIVVGKQKNIPVSVINAPSSVHQPSKSLKSKMFHLIIPILIKTLNFVHRSKLIFHKKPIKRNTILMAIGWNYIGPVVKELKKNRANEIIMFGKDTNISLSSIKEKVTHKCLKDYKIKMGDIELKQAWNELKNHQKFKETMVYQGIPIWSLVEERLGYLFLNRFPNLIKNIEIFEYMRDKESIDMIVVAADVVEFEKTLVTVGNQKGVLSLVVQHGVTGHSVGFVPLSATKFASWGEISKNLLIEWGVPQDKIVITGAPRYDKISRKNSFNKENIYNQLGLDSNKELIVFATQIAGGKISYANLHLSHKEGKDLLCAMTNLMKKYPDKQLVIKLRAAEEEGITQKIVNESYLDNIKITLNINIFELVEACDLLITPWSTVGLEAMIAGKPVITMDLTGRVVPHHVSKRLYAKSGAAMGIYNEEDLIPAIKDALYNEEVRKKLAEARKKFVYEYTYKQDGQASKRVADLIIRMIEESKHAR
jgi:UDP-N-acetylglucosamine 2-epimerase